MPKLTEFEKTILLSFFILIKGSTQKFVAEEDIVDKFPIRQRKMVRQYLSKLAKSEYIIKKGKFYKIDKGALKEISSYLISGPKARL